MKQNKISFKIILNIPFEKALEEIKLALKNEGFGVLMEIDVKNTLKEKINVDFKKYVILGACQPQLAHEALKKDLEAGLLLPCNLVLYEDEGKVVVSAIDPIAMLSLLENQELEGVAIQALERLKKALREVEKNHLAWQK